MRKLLTTLFCVLALGAADRRAPGFAITDSQLKVHDLADYRGKPVILEFMQTTCPHCAEFASVLQQIQQKYGEKVAIVAVVEQPDNTSTVAQYIAGHKVTYPVLFDCGQVGYSYVLSQTMQFPHVFLIDADGMIRRDYAYGPLSRDIFEGNGLMGEIDRLLPGGGAPKKTKK
jgi:thiol-disulfide isomerase/thioredoxin